jgi:hypothetical protein
MYYFHAFIFSFIKITKHQLWNKVQYWFRISTTAQNTDHNTEWFIYRVIHI